MTYRLLYCTHSAHPACFKLSVWIFVLLTSSKVVIPSLNRGNLHYNLTWINSSTCASSTTETKFLTLFSLPCHSSVSLSQTCKYFNFIYSPSNSCFPTFILIFAFGSGFMVLLSPVSHWHTVNTTTWHSSSYTDIHHSHSSTVIHCFHTFWLAWIYCLFPHVQNVLSFFYSSLYQAYLILVFFGETLTNAARMQVVTLLSFFQLP